MQKSKMVRIATLVGAILNHKLVIVPVSLFLIFSAHSQAISVNTGLLIVGVVSVLMGLCLIIAPPENIEGVKKGHIKTYSVKESIVLLILGAVAIIADVDAAIEASAFPWVPVIVFALCWLTLFILSRVYKKMSDSKQAYNRTSKQARNCIN